MYQLWWVEGQNIGEVNVVAKGLVTVFGEAKAKEILETVKTAEGKKRLNENTGRALEAGAFGVPFFVATNADGKEEVFFGVDRLGMVVDFLGLGRGKSESAGGLRALL